MDDFELLQSFDELSKMRTTMQKLFKVKEAVDLVIASITRFVKKRNTNNIVQVPPPRTLDWTPSPYHNNRAKKVKRYSK